MHRYTLRTKALREASRMLSKAALSIITDCIADRDLVYNFSLILSEACANVVRHAYIGLEPGDIEIVIAMGTGEFVELEINDTGRGFPDGPVHVANALPEAEGGRGLYIMSELADEFDIRRRGDTTVVRLKKHIEKHLWKPLE